MDVFAIRHANLLALTERLQSGGRQKKDVATDLDLGASYLSQLLAGKKMGEDVARKIELRAKLSHGYLDRLTEDGARFAVTEQRPGVGSHNLRVDPGTIAEAIKLVRLAFQILDTPHDSETDGIPVALAYEFLSSRAEHTVTPDNLVEFSRKLATRREQLSDEDSGSNRGVGAGDRRAS